MELRGKVVVVTGASSGVGRAIVRALGAQGARVGLIARGVDGLQAAAREIGWTTVLAIVGQALIPGTLDRNLGDKAWSGEVTQRLPPNTADNLVAPLPGDRGAHGAFDLDSRGSSVELWARTHPWAASAALLAAGATLFAALRRR